MTTNHKQYRLDSLEEPYDESECRTNKMTSIKYSISHILPLFIVFVTLNFMHSCKSDDEIAVNKDKIKEMLNTVEVSSLSCISATLTGTIMSESELNRLYPYRTILPGIEIKAEDDYNPQEDNDKEKWGFIQDIDEWKGSHFTCTLYPLQPNSTYYYRPCLFIDHDKIIGEVRSFTTFGIDEFLWMDVSECNFMSAKLSGEIDLEDYMRRFYEVMLSFREIASHSTTVQHIIPDKKGQHISAFINNNIWPGKKYEYWIDVSGDISLTSSKKTFTTPSPAEYIYVDPPSQVTATTALISASLDPKVFYKAKNKTTFIKYGVNKNNLDMIVDVQITDNKIEKSLINLSPSTTYYFSFSAWWAPDDGSITLEFWSEPQSFTTSE